MTTLAEERLRREGEEREHRARQLDRERKHLTVYKQTRVTARCSRCNYERPYTPGAEDEPCTACRGGDGQFWQTQDYRR